MSSEGAVINLLVLKTVAGSDVKVYIAKSYDLNMRKICDVPVPYTDEDMTSYLEDFGVVTARRQVWHIYKEDGEGAFIPLR